MRFRPYLDESAESANFAAGGFVEGGFRKESRELGISHSFVDHPPCASRLDASLKAKINFTVE